MARVLTRWVVACAALAAVSAVRAGSVPLPENPGRGIVPESFPAAPPYQPAPISPEILARRDRLTLADVLEVALTNDPTTQVAWREARSRAETVGVEKSAWWPNLDVTAGATKAKTAVQGGLFTLEQTTYGPGAILTWEILDFGRRSGAVASARADAFAAVWSHSATVQSKVLETTQAYVAYVDAKAQLGAARTTEAETAKNLDAAQQRREAGLATIADVLQARTQHSQATLQMQTIEGSIGSLRGSLATAMGLPANVPFESIELPEEPPVVQFGDSVDALIDKALSQRPDLASAREEWLKAKADVKEVRGSWLPRLDLTGTANKNYYSPAPFVSSFEPWAIGLTLRIPVFNGLRNKHEIARAKEDEAQAAASARSVEQTVINDVWTSWYDLATAKQRVATSKDLLESATESEAVALGRYTEGVGTLLDLLNAQSALALARAQEIAARSDWFSAAAKLLYATGGLTGPEVIPRPAGAEVVR
ncbi:MAG TPA: TolC family protein [Candidatus Polarisedimenticolaceae bacterium]|nr:TolC family protein [Candidatus Polarisedimenticolaceae bacterium]